MNSSLARIEGSAFVYDLDQLAAWAKRVRTAVPAEVELFYACKANPLSHIIRTLAGAGFGFDVASPGELRQARRHAPSSPVLVTGPVKQRAFFDECLQLGVRRFVVESERQLHDLEAAAAGRETEVQALLRLQLEWGEGKSVLGGSSVTAFGMSEEEWVPVLSRFCPRFVRIEGVHVFQWGNENSLSRLEGIWGRVADAAKTFAGRAGFPLRALDLGGGLGIPYGEGELISPEAFGQTLNTIRSSLGETLLILELGRYLAGPCGSYVTTIADRKNVRGKELLLTEGGAHHLVRPALVGQSFPAALLRQSAAALREFQVHGPLCTALDRLGSFSLPEDTLPGDRLVLSQAGAYGFTESMPFFLCHEGAAEFILQNGELRLARAAQKPEDWLV